MTKVRTTVTISDDVLKAVKIRAARTGTRDGDVIEAALRRELGLDVFERLWAHSDLDEDEAMEVALETQKSVRRARKE